MFTGIIQQQGQIEALTSNPSGRRVTLQLSHCSDSLRVGASLAVNGVCLTIAEGSCENHLCFDIIPETLRCSNLEVLQVGDLVNIEPPLGVGDALDGHMLSGHTDGTATLTERADPSGAGEMILRFSAHPVLTEQMIYKGSVALDGVSMTIAGLESGSFSVAAIPTTLKLTTLGTLNVAERVNVELDMIGKWVRRIAEPMIAGVHPHHEDATVEPNLSKPPR